MARKKQMTIVIGSFSDPAHQVWSPDAHAFETAREAVDYLGPQDAYYEDLAYELKVKKEDLPAALERTDPAIAMEALVRVLQMMPGMAIRTFRTIREAEAFLDLIEQIAAKKEKERGRDTRII